MADFFEYEIDGKKYIQRRLVLAQVKQLSELLGQIFLPTDGSMLGIVAALGDKLGRALAIVLIPADTPLQTPDDIKKALQGKDLDKLTSEFDFAVETDMSSLAVEVVNHFLDCNQLSLVFQQIDKLAGKLVGRVNKLAGKMGEIGKMVKQTG